MNSTIQTDFIHILQLQSQLCMDKLTEIVRSLSKEEARNFSLFEQRIRSQKYDKKLLKLYQYIRSGTLNGDDEKAVDKFYEASNRNAYYRLKHRLVEDIEKSLLMLHASKDIRTTIMNLIILARIFYYKTHYALAFHYLKKAEKKAAKEELYDLLHLVYDEIITLSRDYSQVDPLHYIKKKEQYQNEYAQIQRTNYLLATITHRLHKTNFSDRDRGLLDELEDIQTELKLMPESQSTRGKLQVYKCVRDILLQKKDFFNLEAYLVKTYHQFEDEAVFSRANHNEKIVILTWIINTLIKNKKFKRALSVSTLLNQALLAYNKLHYERYIWTYYQSLTAIYSSAGENQKAIDLLEQLKDGNQKKGIPYYDIFIFLNLVKLYFNIENYPEALANLSYLLYQAAYQELSPTMKLNLAITEVMIQVELEDWDYANTRIKECKRKYRTELKQESYERDRNFIQILSSLIKKPDGFKDESIQEEVRTFIQHYTYEVAANDAVNYQAWLYAKLERKHYFDVIMEWLKR